MDDEIVHKSRTDYLSLFCRVHELLDFDLLVRLVVQHRPHSELKVAFLALVYLSRRRPSLLGRFERLTPVLFQHPPRFLLLLVTHQPRDVLDGCAMDLIEERWAGSRGTGGRAGGGTRGGAGGRTVEVGVVMVMRRRRGICGKWKVRGGLTGRDAR